MGNEVDGSGVVRYCAKCFTTLLESEEVCPRCLRREIKKISSPNLGEEVKPSIDLCRAGQRFDLIYSE